MARGPRVAGEYITCPRCLRSFVISGVHAEPLETHHVCPHGQTCEAGRGATRPGEMRAACWRCDERHKHRREPGGYVPVTGAEVLEWCLVNGIETARLVGAAYPETFADRVLVLDFTGDERDAGGVTVTMPGPSTLRERRAAPRGTAPEEPRWATAPRWGGAAQEGPKKASQGVERTSLRESDAERKEREQRRRASLKEGLSAMLGALGGPKVSGGKRGS